MAVEYSTGQLDDKLKARAERAFVGTEKGLSHGMDVMARELDGGKLRVEFSTDGFHVTLDLHCGRERVLVDVSFHLSADFAGFVWNVLGDGTCDGFVHLRYA